MAKNTVHLTIQQYPITFRDGVLTVCGKVLERITIKWTMDGDIRFEDVSRLGNCQKCAKLYAEPVGRVYVYGVTEARAREEGE